MAPLSVVAPEDSVMVTLKGPRAAVRDAFSFSFKIQDKPMPESRGSDSLDVVETYVVASLSQRANFRAKHQGLAATAPVLPNIVSPIVSFGVFKAFTRPRLRRAAFTVLLISMAIVRGPTPPGTGVIAPATSATPG